MARTDQTPIDLRIVIERPVVGVPYSLQSRDGSFLDPKTSASGEALVFDFGIRVAPGPRFLGDQIRSEGPVRRFVYVRIGDLAGDAASAWSRRIKIDIHDIEAQLIAQAADGGMIIETAIEGTGKDGSPTCGTARPLRRGLVGQRGVDSAPTRG